MLLTDYRIDLQQYGGPLDLLLYLVRRHEVDICSISLARITSDFQSYIGVLEFLDFDLIGDFVVVASTLLEIKSREVLPNTDAPVEDQSEEESGSELIGKLLEYRKYKEATKTLDERAADWLERYPRLSSDRPQIPRDRTEDKIRQVELWDLVSALSRIVRIPAADTSGSVRMDETPIGVFQERIRLQVLAEGRAAFSSFFDGERIPSRIAGIFLAILELIRHEDYRAEQPMDFGEIWILPPLTDAP
jgi:segregation and condensation protein A